jgi:hypothetical protein
MIAYMCTELKILNFYICDLVIVFWLSPWGTLCDCEEEKDEDNVPKILHSARIKTQREKN